MGLLDLIWNQNKSTLKRLNKQADKVEALASEMEYLSDDELQAKTAEFKQRYQDGESLDDMLVEAFAVVREGSKRSLGMFPFRVQLIGGMVLHEGDIAEMKTGEGKTLTSTLAIYLNAISGKGVHVITVNEYLATRDKEEMGVLFEFLGLTVGLNLNSCTADIKRNAYACDITYGTNNEFGFDYLRDNMVLYKEKMVQRPLNFAVVDEVDSILVDESRTPLIISGSAQKSTILYQQANMFVKTLKAESDYKVDVKTKSAQLTEDGMSKAERAFGVTNLFDIEHVALYHHINQALHANYCMSRDVDYVVSEEEIIIVDPFTGRLMNGRRYNEGLHQAIEAKENVKVQNESMTLATITFQNYFRMYAKLGGMTGTAKTEEEEFRDIYNMNVVAIPTNRPVTRIDEPDVIYSSNKDKFEAVADDIAERHKKGQPVLIGTVAIETSEVISNLLRKRGIPHDVLNAKQHEREADIILNAGQRGAVTIATNMAGRGTDIKLGEGVADLGGLAVIGTERHESRRIDNQLRGRSGRQGDPGFTQFYLALDDELMKRFGSERMQSFLNNGLTESGPIQSKMISRSVESAQKRVEGNNYDARRNVLKYDDVMRMQREIIYKQRLDIIESQDLTEIVEGLIRAGLENTVYSFIINEETGKFPYQELLTRLERVFIKKGDFTLEAIDGLSQEEIIKTVFNKAIRNLEEKLEPLNAEQVREFKKAMVLRVVDTNWMQHIHSMDQLRQGIHLRAYAQIDPLREYQTEGQQMFDNMIATIETEVSRYILKAELRPNEEVQRKEVAKANATGPKEGAEVKRKPKKSSDDSTNRNAPCPCGSGKKFKHCHGRQ